MDSTLREHRGISSAAKGVATVVERTGCPVQRSETECNRAYGSRSVHGIPLMSVGKGGLQGGDASPKGTKPIRRAWNGQPAFASAKCPYVGADAILTQVPSLDRPIPFARNSNVDDYLR